MNMSSVWLTTPSVVFSIGTTPKLRAPPLHLTEYIFDTVDGNILGGRPELLHAGHVGEGRPRPEIGDLLRALKRQ